MLEQLYNKAKYGLLAARLGGIDYLITELKQRTYRKETFIGLVKHLDEPDIGTNSKIDFSLSLATPEDMEEMLTQAPLEGKNSTFDLVQRKWFYDSGFHNCYVARTIPDSKLCYTQWMISLQDENAGTELFRSSFPRLKDHEIQLEHAYTFTQYRGNKLMPAVMNRLFQIARQRGALRVTTYVLDDNQASLNGCYNAGFKYFEKVRRIKSPFSTQYQITPAMISP